MKKPEYYKSPLRSRVDMIRYIFQQTDQRSYDHRRHPFCFNVKCYHVDFDFDHLLALYVEYEGKCRGQSDPDWLKAVRERYAEVKEHLWEYAQEDACRQFVENDGQRCLWDGTAFDVTYSFEGRSGGWLSIIKFEGYDFTDRDQDIENMLEEMPYRTLRILYKLIVQLVHDLSRVNITKELEFQAAFNFFANCCADIPEPEDAQLELNLA